MPSYTFKKKLRISKNKRFREILSDRKFVKNDLLLLYLSKNELNYSRFAISVGKKFGSAVRRNRLKRMLRESCRLIQDSFPDGYDYFIMFTGKITCESIAKKLKTDEVRNSLEKLLCYARKKYKID